MDTLREAAQETGKAMDSSVRAASELLLSGAHEAAAQYQTTQEHSKRFMDTARAHYQSTEQIVFDKLKGERTLHMESCTCLHRACIV